MAFPFPGLLSFPHGAVPASTGHPGPLATLVDLPTLVEPYRGPSKSLWPSPFPEKGECRLQLSFSLRSLERKGGERESGLSMF